MSLSMYSLFYLIVVLHNSFGDERSSSAYTDQLPRNSNSFDCLEAFNNCRGIPQCRTALHGLNKRCKVVDGRCSAEMVDLPRCGQIMDHLFSYGFSEKKCNCDQKRSERCLSIVEKIYNNPCFVSIRHLRKIDLFPKEVDAYDIASTTATMTKQTINNNINKNEDQNKKENNIVSMHDEIMDDEAIKFPQTSGASQKKTKSIDRLEERNNAVTNHKAKEARNTFSSKTVKKDRPSPTIDPNGKITTTKANRKNFGVQEENPRSETKEHMKNDQFSEATETTKRKKKEDNTNYKLITIVLGLLLGICVLITVIYFAWARLTGAIFYTKCKTVHTDHHRQDEESTTTTNSSNHHQCNVKKDGTSSEQLHSRA